MVVQHKVLSVARGTRGKRLTRSLAAAAVVGLGGGPVAALAGGLDYTADLGPSAPTAASLREVWIGDLLSARTPTGALSAQLALLGRRATASAMLGGERVRHEFFFRNADDDAEVYAAGGFMKYAYLAGSPLKWGTTVTWLYNPAGQLSGFSQADILATLQKATANWMAVCNVKFAYGGLTNAAPSMSGCDGRNVVGWQSLSGGTVGQTQACYSGSSLTEFDAVFDNQAPAQITSLALLEAIATHEFGHSLGLGHTSVSPAIMTSSVSTDALVNDDIAGCQSLYGTGSASSTSSPPPPPPSSSPVASFSTTALSFPALSVGATSAPQSVRVTNSGSGSLTITGLSVSGANAADFNRSGSCWLNEVLYDGQYCDVTITFTPHASGKRNATLAIATDSNDGVVGLSGSGKRR